MPTGGMRYPTSYAGNDATNNYIRQQQNYIQQLQQELQNLRTAQYPQTVMPVQAATVEETSSPQLTAPTRHAEITLVKSKKEVLDAEVDLGTSRMFMTEDDQYIYLKSVDKNGKATLHPYLHQDPENITTSNDYVTKDDLKAMLSGAVEDFSKLVPSADTFVRKDEIRDIIVETLSSNRMKKKEEGTSDGSV